MAQEVSCLGGGTSLPCRITSSQAIGRAHGSPRHASWNDGLPAFFVSVVLVSELSQRVAEVREHAVHSCRDAVNAGDARERDQGADQCIFNQFLALFALRQILQ